jgi:electron transfer flavoprotein beta subunit
MNILVLLKQTFDTEEQIIIENNEIQEDGIEFIINPYDEYAVEEAVSLKEEHGGEVTVLTVGPPRSEQALRTALAMGADKAIVIDNEDLPDDELILAKVISALIKEKEFDIILGGYMSVDNGAAQVGPRVAEELDIPHVSTAVNLKVQENRAYIERDVEGSIERIEVDFPVLITAQQGLNEPRYPSLPAVMKAKRKPIERLTPDDIGISVNETVTKIDSTSYFLPPKREAGLIFQGELEEQVKELAQALMDRKKVI